MNPKTTSNLFPLKTFSIASIILAGAFTATSHAQLGTGWTQYSPSRTIQLDKADGSTSFSWATTTHATVDSPKSAEYLRSGETETFWIYDNRSNRAEIRVQNDYSTGTRQFQGYVLIKAPLDDESLMQIFGSTEGATQLMLRGFAASGGSISGGGASITGIYGVETRVNVLHFQGDKVDIYFNGTRRGGFTDNEAVTNYQKYGCYGTLHTGSVEVRWRQIRFYKDGTSTPPASPITGRKRIIARHSGKAVAVQSASTADGADVIQWTYTSTTDNDEWDIIDIGGGYYRVMNALSGKALNVQSASTADGGDIIQWTYGGTATNDEWSIQDAGGGYYRFINRNSGKAMDVSGASTADGADIVQWTSDGATNQQFQIISS